MGILEVFKGKGREIKDVEGNVYKVIFLFSSFKKANIEFNSFLEKMQRLEKEQNISDLEEIIKLGLIFYHKDFIDKLEKEGISLLDIFDIEEVFNPIQEALNDFFIKMNKKQV